MLLVTRTFFCRDRDLFDWTPSSLSNVFSNANLSTFQRVNTPIREVKGAGWGDRASIWSPTSTRTPPRASPGTTMQIRIR